MEIILSTRNPTKVIQISAIFANMDVTVRSLADVGIEGDVVEDGTTLGENASKKALYAWNHTKQWCMADDTGLYIDALDGQPGIHAARWAGDVSTEEIRDFTLAKLAHVSDSERTATFETAAVIISPKGEQYIFKGSLTGIILKKPRTSCQPKMPYSSIFMPSGAKKVLAEMSASEVNAISHRGKAFAQVRAFFERTIVEGRT